MAESLSILADAEEHLPQKMGLIVILARDLEEILNTLTPLLASSPLTQKLYVAKSLEQARQLILALHDQVA